MVSPRDGWPRRGRTRLCTYPRADHRNRAAVAARTGREGAALAGALVLVAGIGNELIVERHAPKDILATVRAFPLDATLESSTGTRLSESS
jgi:hypothetical protein